MAPLFLIVLLVVPLVELWVIVSVASSVGVPETILLLVAISAAGAWLLKQQGMQTWRRLQLSLQRGAMPADEVTDGALILFGGALLLTPGFLTDLVGLLLLLPPTRAVVKRAFRKLFARWMLKSTGYKPRPRPSEAEVVKVERVRDRPRAEPPPHSSLDEGGSPDRS
ncbi:MAG: FxsA family protein [Actinomycetota bacterium]|nr:FxsA family protein [Actinomycetota bacterium]